MTFTQIWDYLKGRLGEPSTYAGAAVILFLLSGVEVPVAMFADVGAPLVKVVSGVMAIVALFKKDPGS